MADADPDLPLIERVGRGEQAAARQLVLAKLPRVMALATRMLNDSTSEEDVAQEAFVRVWKHAASWQPGRARFDTWLHTVVLNLCRDRLRMRRHESSAEMPELTDPAPGAETALIAAEQGRSVAAAIGALPERQREAILLVHYQDLSGTEAALALGVSVEALESLLARGRRALRAQLSKVREMYDD